MTENNWVRHLTAEDILDLQSLMLLLAGRDMEERESAFKGILEIMNPVVVGVRSMEAIKPAYVISEAIAAEYDGPHIQRWDCEYDGDTEDWVPSHWVLGEFVLFEDHQKIVLGLMKRTESLKKGTKQ